MEITYKGQRFTVHPAGIGLKLISDRGKHYCQTNHCQHCEDSTPDNDAHLWECDFPREIFKDDQGNTWAYSGCTGEENSSSFGWWREDHSWVLAGDACNYADEVDMKKIRRRCEDALRKCSQDKLLWVATLLQVRMD